MKRSLFILALACSAFAAKKNLPKKATPPEVQPRLQMLLNGGLGMTFGQNISMLNEMLALRGYTQKLDSLPQCAEMDLVCKSSYTSVIVSDSNQIKSFASKPLNLNGFNLQSLNLSFGSLHDLESFSFETLLPAEQALVHFNASNAKITEKYGIASCEVKSETIKDQCEVLTWDFGNDGTQGSIQSSLANNTMTLSYKSAQAIRNLLNGGQLLVQTQNTLSNIPVQPNSNDF